MKNINLSKITLGVAFAAFTTFIVSANEILPKESEVATESETSLTSQTFSQLLSQFDTDSNGSLSESELSTSGNEALKIAFKSLDENEDENISEDEFSTYVNTKLN